MRTVAWVFVVLNALFALKSAWLKEPWRFTISASAAALLATALVTSY